MVLQLNIRKPGKFHTVKFVIGAGPEIPNNGDHYKSGTVSVKQGLPASSKNPKRPRGVSSKVDYSKYYNRGAARKLLPHRLHQGIINQHQLLIQVIWLNRHIQYHSNHSNHSNTNHNSHNNKHHIQLNHQSHLLTRINPVNLKERYHHQHQAYKFLQHKLHLGNRQHSKDKHQLITQLRLQIDLLLQPLLLLLVIQVDQLKQHLLLQ